MQAAERAIDKQVVLNATLDQAWDAWTTREGIVGFFAPDAKVEPRVGGAFQVYMDPGAPAGSKGADDMRFMALQPKKMLSFDWNAPPSLPEARAQRTFVVVRFEPLSDQQTTASRCTTPAGATAASGTRPTPTSTRPGATCWPTWASVSTRARRTGAPGWPSSKPGARRPPPRRPRRRSSAQSTSRDGLAAGRGATCRLSHIVTASTPTTTASDAPTGILTRSMSIIFVPMNTRITARP